VKRLFIFLKADFSTAYLDSICLVYISHHWLSC